MMRNLLLFFTSILLSFSIKAQTTSSFTSSNLPLVVIQTNGQTIPDEPKINAHLGIVWNGEGSRNFISDAFNSFNGPIAIEIRGSSSQMFPKKSYGFELQDEFGQDTSLTILGMPKESDWILYAPYSDKSLIRNVLTYNLDASLGHYAPRCQFVELFLNDVYQGVYVLMEKIKRDNDRVDIAKLLPEDNTAEEISGGYIIKIDKTTGDGGGGWFSSYPSQSYKYTYFQYDYPKEELISTEQKNYIRGYIDVMEKAIYDGNFEGENGFRELADEPSFIDFMLINELAKNVDGYRLSTYMYKDKGEKIKMGPIWDFNLAYGNAYYYDGVSTSGFQFQANLGDDYWQNPFWWKNLFQDNTYRRNLKERWKSLRQNELSSQRITFVIDSLTSLLGEAQVRNFSKWPILSEYVWPNAYVGNTYGAEVSWLKSWISSRLVWLDGEIDRLYVGVGEFDETAEAVVFPNPFRNKLTFQLGKEINDRLSLRMFNINGLLIMQKEIDLAGTGFSVTDNELQALSPGVYFIQLSENGQVIFSGKMMKN